MELRQCHRSPSASQGSAIWEPCKSGSKRQKPKEAPYTAFGKGGGQSARLVQTDPGGSPSIRRALPDRHRFYPSYDNRWCWMMMMTTVHKATYHSRKGDEPLQATPRQSLRIAVELLCIRVQVQFFEDQGAGTLSPCYHRAGNYVGELKGANVQGSDPETARPRGGESN